MSLKAHFQQRSTSRRYDFVIVGGRKVWMWSLMALERQHCREAFLNSDGEDARPDAPMARQAMLWCESIVSVENPVQDEATKEWKVTGATREFEGSEDDLKLLMALPAVDVDALNSLLNRLSLAISSDIAKNLESPPAVAS